MGESDSGLGSVVAEVGSMGCWGRIGEEMVYLAGDVAFQAADYLGVGFSLCLSSGDIFFGAGVVTHSVGSDPP